VKVRPINSERAVPGVLVRTITAWALEFPWGRPAVARRTAHFAVTNKMIGILPSHSSIFQRLADIREGRIIRPIVFDTRLQAPRAAKRLSPSNFPGARRPWRRRRLLRALFVGWQMASGTTGDPSRVSRGNRPYAVGCLIPKKGTCGPRQISHIWRDD
jgi:hypothetical protein